MTGLRTRLARPDELTEIGKITVEAYLADGLLTEDHPYLSELADAPRRAAEAELVVAVDEDDQPVGTVTVCLPGTPFAEISRPGELEFRMLAVAPHARGRGAGGVLMDAVFRKAEELRVHRIVLSSSVQMHTAHRLYRRLGFTRLPDRDWSPTGDVSLIAFALPTAAR